MSEREYYGNRTDHQPIRASGPCEKCKRPTPKAVCADCRAEEHGVRVERLELDDDAEAEHLARADALADEGRIA